jgi:hypothetical protein
MTLSETALPSEHLSCSRNITWSFHFLWRSVFVLFTAFSAAAALHSCQGSVLPVVQRGTPWSCTVMAWGPGCVYLRLVFIGGGTRILFALANVFSLQKRKKHYMYMEKETLNRLKGFG